MKFKRYSYASLTDCKKIQKTTLNSKIIKDKIGYYVAYKNNY